MKIYIFKEISISYQTNTPKIGYVMERLWDIYVSCVLFSSDRNQKIKGI